MTNAMSSNRLAELRLLFQDRQLKPVTQIVGVLTGDQLTRSKRWTVRRFMFDLAYRVRLSILTELNLPSRFAFRATCCLY